MPGWFCLIGEPASASDYNRNHLNSEIAQNVQALVSCTADKPRNIIKL